MQLSVQQVLQLAPDAAAAKAGQGLAKPAKWQELARQGNIVWGLCQGSGAHPYRTQADLSEPAFRCSCPSRKFPCKHGLGLLLILAEGLLAFPESTPPDWVQAWIDGRASRAAKLLAPAPAAIEDAQAASARAVQQARRAEKREARVAAGLDEMARWLEDMVRTGLVAAKGQPYAYWDAAAARLVDAQAPGVARRVRQLPQVLNAQDWQDQLLAELGNLYLLQAAWRNLDSLCAPVQADVRASIGFTVDQQQILQQPGLLGRWQVLAVLSEQEEQLLVRRTWLQALDGEHAGKLALLLDFVVASQSIRATPLLPPGTVLQAEVVYFPSNAAQRALLKPGHVLLDSRAHFASKAFAWTSIPAFLQWMAQQLAANPWLERCAAVLADMYLVRRNGTWMLRDAAGVLLPLVNRHFSDNHIWLLHAIADAGRLSLTGEWRAGQFLPLSFWSDASWHAFPQEQT